MLYEGLINMNSESINLFWVRTPEESNYVNFGDALSAIVTASISKQPVTFTHPNFYIPTMTAIGTIGHSIINGPCKIWGTGFDASINQSYPETRRYMIPKNTTLEVHATRGRFSELLLKSQGVDTSGIYGDPGWFAKYLVPEKVNKKWELGIIVNITELETLGLDAIVKSKINRYRIPEHMRSSVQIIHTFASRSVDGVLDKIREIKSCKRILSTSLHGLVIAEMFNIPCAWFGHSNLKGLKSPIYVFKSNLPMDHRMRDFYSSTESHDYVLTYHQLSNEFTDFDDAISYIDNNWVPVVFDEQSLLNAFPYAKAYDSDLFKLELVQNNLKDEVL